MQIENRDWVNWEESMSAAPGEVVFEPVTRIRPGHADFTGAMKYGHQDIRNVIERSSSRETAARVAVGGLCRQLLNVFGIAIHSHVLAIADVGYTTPRQFIPDAYPAGMWETVEASAVRCADVELTEKMIARILAAKHEGDTWGELFGVLAFSVAIGRGGFNTWDRRLSS